VKKDVIIIGGGLSGLVNAIVLAGRGWNVLLIEKQSYPFHKVCGEYVSQEVLPFLSSLGANPADEMALPFIRKLTISATSGKTAQVALDTGGFGISRYRFDEYLYRKALQAGASVITETTVTAVSHEGDEGMVKTSAGEIIRAKVIIGAFGKHSNIDRLLSRPFFLRKSPYIGVKHHFDFPVQQDLVALHNFPGGYCGVSAVEDNITNVCYLTTQGNLKRSGSVEKMEELVLSQNPHLRKIFANGKKRFAEPKVISQVSFEPKKAVEDHILMSGDAAGLIAPLSGNGMAMAIHAAKICSAQVHRFLSGELSREGMESEYARKWHGLFYRRLQTGMRLQSLFGRASASEFSLAFFRTFPGALRRMIRNTHGKPFGIDE